MNKVNLKSKKVFIPTLCVIVVAIGLGVYFSESKKVNSTPQSFSRGNKLTTKATIGNINSSITASGAIEIKEAKTYYSETGSKIDEIFFDSGDDIKVGDIILTYDTKELVQSINELKVSIDNDTITLNALINGPSETEEMSLKDSITSAEKSLASASSTYNEKLASLETQKDKVALAETNVASANREMESYKKLYDAGAESLTTYNNYVKAYNEKLNDLNSAKRELANSTSIIDSAKKDIEYANISLQNANKKYELAKNPLTDTNTKNTYTQQLNNIELQKQKLQDLQDEYDNIKDGVKASQDGTIITMNGSNNGSIAEGSALFTYTNYNNLVVTSTVSQYEVADVFIGQKVKMYTDNDTKKIYSGEIIEIGNEATEASINNGTVKVVPITISIDASSKDLKPGYEINAEVLITDLQNIIILPVSSVVTTKEGTFVFVVENSAIKRTPVETGETDDSFIEVKNITEGTEVISVASPMFKDGMTLEEIQAQSEASTGNSGKTPTQGGGMQGVRTGGTATFQMQAPAGGSMPSGGMPSGQK